MTEGTKMKSVAVFFLSCVSVTCLGAISRHKRQTAALCPESDGRFSMDDDCKRFIECFEGIPEIKTCPDRLVFNPQAQQCDRAGSVDGCRDQGHPSDILCDRSPGRSGQSWKVAHYTFCNAFYTCEEHFVHRRCEFCGEGTYFSETNGFCVGFNQNESTSSECGQKQIVPHGQKAILELYPDCSLFQINPFQLLITKLAAQLARVPGILQGGQSNFGLLARPVNQQVGQGSTRVLAGRVNQNVGQGSSGVFTRPVNWQFGQSSPGAFTRPRQGTSGAFPRPVNGYVSQRNNGVLTRPITRQVGTGVGQWGRGVLTQYGGQGSSRVLTRPVNRQVGQDNTGVFNRPVNPSTGQRGRGVLTRPNNRFGGQGSSRVLARPVNRQAGQDNTGTVLSS